MIPESLSKFSLGVYRCLICGIYWRKLYKFSDFLSCDINRIQNTLWSTGLLGGTGLKEDQEAKGMKTTASQETFCLLNDFFLQVTTFIFYRGKLHERAQIFSLFVLFSQTCQNVSSRDTLGIFGISCKFILLLQILRT